MLFPERIVVVRGGGDLATGVVWRLTRSGFPVVVSELAAPLTIRRAVAVSTAATEERFTVEDLTAVLCRRPAEALATARRGDVPVLVDPGLPAIGAWAVVDARMAKRNIDTTRDDADLVVALGPGFVAGEDCDAVIETMRGHRLGRVIWGGPAAPNSATPADLGGRSAERVLRAPVDGVVRWQRSIGDLVSAGAVLGAVDGREVTAPFDGVVRGLIADGRDVPAGLKIADVDPRADPAAAFEISDKALAVGGGVLEAMMTWLNR